MNCKLNKLLILILTIITGIVYTMTAPAWALTSGTVNIRISDGNDDAEEDVNDGDMHFTSTDLEMVHDSVDQIVGLRFRNITIPQGSSITNAYIQFTTDEVSTSATDLTISLKMSTTPRHFPPITVIYQTEPAQALPSIGIVCLHGVRRVIRGTVSKPRI